MPTKIYNQTRMSCNLTFLSSFSCICTQSEKNPAIRKSCLTLHNSVSWTWPWKVHFQNIYRQLNETNLGLACEWTFEGMRCGEFCLDMKKKFINNSSANHSLKLKHRLMMLGCTGGPQPGDPLENYLERVDKCVLKVRDWRWRDNSVTSKRGRITVLHSGI